MEIDAIIEDPRGSTVRHHWNPDEARWIEKPHPKSMTPWPANYGYIPGTWNQADEDDLDLLVLSREALSTGSQVRVRAVGLLERPDGDDKILGVLVDDADFGDITGLDDVPEYVIQEINEWFAAWSEVGRWRDERAAGQRIQEARVHAR